MGYLFGNLFWLSIQCRYSSGQKDREINRQIDRHKGRQKNTEMARHKYGCMISCIEKPKIKKRDF